MGAVLAILRVPWRAAVGTKCGTSQFREGRRLVGTLPSPTKQIQLRRDSKAVMPRIANPVSPVRLRVAPPNKKASHRCEAFLLGLGAHSVAAARFQRVPRIENARVSVDKDSCRALGFQIGCIGLCCDRVFHRNQHVQVRLHAHQMNAKAAEPRVRSLVVSHARILLQANFAPRRRSPQRRVGQSAVCEPWCPGRESNPHTFRSRILSPLRLPVSSPGPGGRDDSQKFDGEVSQAGAASQQQLHRFGRAGTDHTQVR